jgi:hypothetical protein
MSRQKITPTKHKQIQKEPKPHQSTKNQIKKRQPKQKGARAPSTKTDLNHKVPQKHKTKNNQTKKIIPTKTRKTTLNKPEPPRYIKNTARARTTRLYPTKEEKPAMIPAENACA